MQDTDEVVVEAPGIDVHDERLGGLTEDAQELLRERARGVDVLGVGAREIGREVVERRSDRNRRDDQCVHSGVAQQGLGRGDERGGVGHRRRVDGVVRVRDRGEAGREARFRLGRERRKRQLVQAVEHGPALEAGVREDREPPSRRQTVREHREDLRVVLEHVERDRHDGARAFEESARDLPVAGEGRRVALGRPRAERRAASLVNEHAPARGREPPRDRREARAVEREEAFDVEREDPDGRVHLEVLEKVRRGEVDLVAVGNRRAREHDPVEIARERHEVRAALAHRDETVPRRIVEREFVLREKERVVGVLRDDAEAVSAYEDRASRRQLPRFREGRFDLVLEDAVPRLREAARDQDDRACEVPRTEVPDGVARAGGRNRDDREVHGGLELRCLPEARHAVDRQGARMHGAQAAVSDRFGRPQVAQDDAPRVRVVGGGPEDDGAFGGEELLDLLERAARPNDAALREARLPVRRHPAPVAGQDDGIDLDLLDRRKTLSVFGGEGGEDARELFEPLRDCEQRERSRGVEPSPFEEKPERGTRSERLRKILGDAPGLKDDGRRASRETAVPLGQDSAEPEEEHGPEGDVLLERNEHLRRRRAHRLEAFEQEEAEARGAGCLPARFREHALRPVQNSGRLAAREGHAAHVRLVEEAGRDDLEDDIVARGGLQEAPDVGGHAVARRAGPKHVPGHVEPRACE